MAVMPPELIRKGDRLISSQGDDRPNFIKAASLIFRSYCPATEELKSLLSRCPFITIGSGIFLWRWLGKWAAHRLPPTHTRCRSTIARMQAESRPSNQRFARKRETSSRSVLSSPDKWDKVISCDLIACFMPPPSAQTFLGCRASSQANADSSRCPQSDLDWSQLMICCSPSVRFSSALSLWRDGLSS